MRNRRVTLASRPQGMPSAENFALEELEVPELEAGQFLVEARFLSVDPYMRGRMNDAKSYAEPVGIGEVMVGESVGHVVQSRHDRYPEGSTVSGMFGWQELAVSDGVGVRKVDPNVAPISTALHVLGMPGLTAYFGLHDVCQASEGDTVVVSAAAGAVGSTVGQLAKHQGCRVVGVAGSDEKLDFLKELGFDASFNYRRTDDYFSALRECCPDGIDAYFDNVGGPLTDCVIAQLNQSARVAICGQISQYNLTEPELGPRLLWHLIVKRATIQGFLVLDYMQRFPEALGHLSKLYADGSLKFRERVTDGIENAPQAFIELLQGANIGKQLVRLGS